MRLVSGPRGPRAMVEGRPCLLLNSDNYLGIADHPRVRDAAALAAARWGGGAGSPRTASGEMSIHRRLERALAEFVGYESALVQGPSHMSVAATVAALARPDEVVFSDSLNHPGITAGCRLSGAEVFVYDHLDLDHLEWGLERAVGAGSLIVSEAVFGARGDRAAIVDLAEIAADHDCRLLVEESHAIGAVGPEGRGLVAATGLAGEVDVVIASLGKALGSYGSFVACDAEMAAYLAHASASMRFSTALPPAVVAAAFAALDIVREDPYRVERLRVNAICLRQALERCGLDPGESESQIVAITAGDAASVEGARDRALTDGILTGTVEPPLVGEADAALRLTAIATHRGTELEAAADVVAHAVQGASTRAASRRPRLRAVRDGDEVLAASGSRTEREARPERDARRYSSDFEVPEWLHQPDTVEVPDWIRAA